MNALSPFALTMPSVIVDRAAFSRAVDVAASAVEKRNTYPILANLRLLGDGGQLFITADDLDLRIDVAVPAAADSRFDTTMPAQMLKQMLKGAPKADYVAITQNDDKAAEVDFETARSTVACRPSTDFPRARMVDYSHRFTMSGAALVALLQPVQFCISSEETRYYLNGIFVHAIEARHDGPAVLRAVATDGHRMARQDCAAPEGSAGMPGLILPKKLVALALKHMRGKLCPDQVEIEAGAKGVRLHFDGITITSKVIDGTFPDYERVTPKSNDKVMTVYADALAQGLAAVSGVASDKGGKAVKLAIADGELRFVVTNPDNGTAESVVAANVDGMPEYFEIGFNIRYLADMLANCGSDTVTAQFNDAGSPTLFKGRDSWLGVLMPMRV